MTEIHWLGALFGSFDYDDSGMTWVHLHRVPLPGVFWNKSATHLLLTIPEAYPELPPTHFYVDNDLRDRRGRAPYHYFHSNPLMKGGWAWLCLHLEDGWSPSHEIEDGDNLLTVVERILLGFRDEV